MPDEANGDHETRQERREHRRRKRTEMRKHGANLGAVFGNAVLKRLRVLGGGGGARKKRKRR
jgi:hypothetical protein